MKNFLKHYFKGDPVIWVIYILLVMISIVAFYSAGSPLLVDGMSELRQHIEFLIGGFGVLMAVYLMVKTSKKTRNLLLWISAGMLVIGVIVQILAYRFGDDETHRRLWHLQPSELIKFALIFITAFFIDKFKNQNNPDFLQKNFKWFFAIVWLPLLPVIPINGSMGLIIVIPIVLMMIVAAIPLKKIGYFIGIPMVVLGLLIVIAYNIPKTTYDHYNEKDASPWLTVKVVKGLEKFRVQTWNSRIKTWWDDVSLQKASKDPQAESALHAIHDGRIPLGPGNSKWRNVVEQAWSDYIFAIIVEEYGFIGALLVILLFLSLFWRAGMLVRMQIQQNRATVYSSIVIIGAATVIILQAFVHIGTCTRLIPATGQPLPLISKGGNSILIISAFFGLLLGMSCEMEDVEDKNIHNISDENIFDENIVQNEILDEKIEEIPNEIIETIKDDKIAETTEIEII